MLENLITSKTRVKLLLKFFLNSTTQAHLRGLESEFGESTNAIRLELNRFEQAGMLTSHLSGNKKVFSANPSYPLFPRFKYSCASIWESIRWLSRSSKNWER
jgi:predicted transcriptional regulator